MNEPYYRAFTDLSSARDWIGGGMAAAVPKSIAYSEKVEWARANGYASPPVRFERFMYLVAVQDDEYLTWFAERTKT